MSDAKRCDRCGTYYVEKEKKYKVGGGILASINFVSKQNNIIKYFDLCDECAEKLDQFMNPEMVKEEEKEKEKEEEKEKEKEKEKESAGKIEKEESIGILPCICEKQPTHKTWYGPDMFERHSLYCRDCGIAAVTSNYVIEAARNWNKKISDIMAMKEM